MTPGELYADVPAFDDVFSLALEICTDLDGGGGYDLVGGILGGVVLTIPLFLV